MKKNHCYCCNTAKSIEHFDAHGNGRTKLFCKPCYKNYTHAERKERRVKFFFDTIKSVKF